MKTDLSYIDREYHFKGQWEVDSVCGLKIVEKTGKHIVIATEFYDRNPGTSITNFCAQLAMNICGKFEIDLQHLVFIEHSPDRDSKLEFYSATFDLVHFDWDGRKLSNPQWERITKEEVDELIG